MVNNIKIRDTMVKGNSRLNNDRWCLSKTDVELISRIYEQFQKINEKR